MALTISLAAYWVGKEKQLQLVIRFPSMQPVMQQLQTLKLYMQLHSAHQTCHVKIATIAYMMQLDWSHKVVVGKEVQGFINPSFFVRYEVYLFYEPTQLDATPPVYVSFARGTLRTMQATLLL